MKVAEVKPFEVGDGNKMEWIYQPVPTKLCDGCEDRVAAGQKPACEHHCLAFCIEHGPIEDMAARAAELGGRVRACFCRRTPLPEPQARTVRACGWCACKRPPRTVWLGEALSSGGEGVRTAPLQRSFLRHFACARGFFSCPLSSTHTSARIVLNVTNTKAAPSSTATNAPRNAGV